MPNRRRRHFAHCVHRSAVRCRQTSNRLQSAIKLSFPRRPAGLRKCACRQPELASPLSFWRASPSLSASPLSPGEPQRKWRPAVRASWRWRNGTGGRLCAQAQRRRAGAGQPPVADSQSPFSVSIKRTSSSSRPQVSSRQPPPRGSSRPPAGRRSASPRPAASRAPCDNGSQPPPAGASANQPTGDQANRRDQTTSKRASERTSKRTN